MRRRRSLRAGGQHGRHWLHRSNKAVIVRDNTLINLHTIEAAREQGVKRCYIPPAPASIPAICKIGRRRAAQGSRCVSWRRRGRLRLGETLHGADLPALLGGFWPGDRTVRFHNIYGPLGTYDGGREKSPAAICRKVALASDGDAIEVWGDGEQTRSFCYIDDCVEGIYGPCIGFSQPSQHGIDRLITIDDLAPSIVGTAGKTLGIRHVEGPQGVRGRELRQLTDAVTLGWEPQISLRDGLTMTYDWIQAQVKGTVAITTAAEGRKCSPNWPDRGSHPEWTSSGVGVSAIDMPISAEADRPMDIERLRPVCMRHGSPRRHGVTARSETSRRA